MNILKIGDNAPDFSCKNQYGNTINLSDKDVSINSIKEDDIFDYNLELKNLDILFKKIENDN